MNDRDLDAEFQRIVAGWDAEAPDPLADREHTAGRMPSGDDPAPAGDPLTSDEGTGGSAAKTTGVNPAPLSPAAPAAPAAPAVPAAPTDQTGAAGPAATDVAHGGDLGLPIASTTSHVWRSGAPSDAVDDVDALLDAASAARGGEPDDHFVPPSEIELPSAETDPMFWAIVGGLVGGPLLLFYLLFFDRDGSGWWVVTAIAMVVIGFVLLVLRGGNERDPFDDGTRV
ncbi:MAG TPA: hypothetical protein VFL38_15120 [Humibacillus xanthopallidus]|nr:hypothetical protein [Humibacillus xanthopallidus]